MHIHYPLYMLIEQKKRKRQYRQISYSVEIDVINKQSFVHLFGWNDESLNLAKVFFIIGLKPMFQHTYAICRYADDKIPSANHIYKILDSYPVLNCEIQLMQIVHLFSFNSSSSRLDKIHWRNIFTVNCNSLDNEFLFVTHLCYWKPYGIEIV